MQQPTSPGPVALGPFFERNTLVFCFCLPTPPSPNAPPFLDPFSDQIYLEASEQVSSDVGCRGQSPRDGKVERWKRGSKDKQKIWRAACQLDIVLRLQSPLAALHGLQDLSAPAGNWTHGLSPNHWTTREFHSQFCSSEKQGNHSIYFVVRMKLHYSCVCVCVCVCVCIHMMNK